MTKSYRTDPSHSLIIRQSSISRLMREYSGKSRKTLQDSVLVFKGASSKENTDFSGNVAKCIEDSSLSLSDLIECTAEQVFRISNAFDIPATRLFAGGSNDGDNKQAVCISKAVDFNSFGPNDWPETPENPRNAIYRFPRSRLKNTDHIEIGEFVLLEQDSQSESHAHPGDEIAIVRKGEVVLRLNDTGVQNLLKEGDLVHFYSEQNHCFVNVANKPAELLVIRRQPVMEQTRLRALSPEKSKRTAPKTTLERLERELETNLFFNHDFHENEFLRDHYGLTYMLDAYRTARGLKLKDLEEKGRQLGFSYTTNFFSRLSLGDIPVSLGDINNISKVFGVSPLTLYEFSSPAHRIVVTNRKNDLEQVPNEYLTQSSTTSPTFSIPKRRLATFGISMCMVTIDAGGEVQEHSHPGYEIIVPLQGRVRLVWGTSLECTIDFDEHSFAHYDSNRPHSVQNPGSEKAVFWVFRLFDSGEPLRG